jgi:hypothetical protein
MGADVKPHDIVLWEVEFAEDEWTSVFRNFVVWRGKFEFLGFTLKEPDPALFVQVKLHTPQGLEDL